MAYNNNGNQQQRSLVSTIGNQFYGISPEGDKALSISYLENNLSIGIHGTLNNPQDPTKKYDYKSGNIIYLPGKKAKSLARIVTKIRNQIAENSDVEEIAVNASSNLIEVSDGTKFGLNQGVTIAVYNNINENKISEAFAIFQFRNEDVISGYDYKSGTYNKSTLDADVDFFIDALKEFSKASTNAYAHFNKKEFNFNMNGVVNRQKQIMQALGIQAETPASVRGNWNQNSYNNSSNGSVKSFTTESLINELDSLS